MSRTLTLRWIATLSAAILFVAPSHATAQGGRGGRHPRSDAAKRVWHPSKDSVPSIDDDESVTLHFNSRDDSLSWLRGRNLAHKSTGLRLVVSLQERHLWAIAGGDTLLSAPVAVAKGTTLEYGSKAWHFTTPRGMRTVLSKDADPIWQPPEWLYAETAVENGLKLKHLDYGEKVHLGDGRTLTIVDGSAGIIDTDGSFGDLPTDEHIVFGDYLYMPPMGSKNRKVEGELGKYKLSLGDGYLLHGTPDKQSIGMAATHGCIRLRDEDIEWLYDNVPVGTKVYIY